MKKNVVTVGFEIPAFSNEFIGVASDQSILDHDVIVFQPTIAEFSAGYTELFQGKPSLHENASFRLREAATRWRTALGEAVGHGKTVFIFMSALEDVFVDTGQRRYSGTGRNRHTTNIVEAFNNYSMLPLAFAELTAARGKEIKPAGDLKGFARYWSEFKAVSSYELYFQTDGLNPLFVTRTGNKPVGGTVRHRRGTTIGTFVLLPPVHYDRDIFIKVKDGKHLWTKEAIAFGAKLRSVLLEIDEALRGADDITPPPDWVSDPTYRLAIEQELEVSISAISVKIEELQAEKAALGLELGKASSIRRLLFEKGQQLESAILEALQILGLEAQTYKEGGSEFDVVFVWKTQRFLGEAEGKDNKAVNIDKMSQLERNLSEDFARDEVSAYAKGILFGNAFRFDQPSERGDFFTEKCVSAAKRVKAALVRTPDLFIAAKYVKDTGDLKYAEQCIKAVLDSEGEVVTFPPTSEGTKTNATEPEDQN